MYEPVEEREGIVRIGHDRALKAAVMTWLKNDNTIFREMLEIELRIVREHALLTVIVDTTDVKGALSEDNQQWLAEDFMPRLGTSGLRALVSVVPRSAIAMLVNRRSFRGNDHGLIITEVATVEEAREVASRVAAGIDPAG